MRRAAGAGIAVVARSSAGVCLCAGALLWASAGCDAGVRGRTGLGALMQVNGATLVEGALSPAADPSVIGGPVVSVNQFHGLAFPGANNRTLAGSVQQGARSIAVGLADDSVYWIVPAPIATRDIVVNTDLLFSTTVSYATDIGFGPHNLVLRAILADGRMGPPAIQTVMINDFTGIKGTLQVRLSWDTNADLDLHVVVPVTPPNPPDPKVPGTIEVWLNRPSSLPARPIFDPYTPEDIVNGGVFDYDSNGACVIDGRRQENIVWGGPPPRGRYIVRVDAVSLCGEVDAQWQVDVFKDGNPAPVSAAFGEMVDSDTRFSHREGSGVLALEFDVP